MDAHLAARKLMLCIPLGRERVASDSLFLLELISGCDGNSNAGIAAENRARLYRI